MKLLDIIKIALPALLLAFTSCRSTKTAEKTTVTTKAEGTGKQEMLRKVAAVSHADTRFVTSKIKLNLSVGGQDLSLSGNLKMKRDEVIRLQLVALGLIEAGRIELTPDYMLVMDRINKQYIKVAYSDVDFLRESGLNFHSLQSLFWDELFEPGTTTVTTKALDAFNAYEAGTDVAVMLERGPADVQMDGRQGQVADKDGQRDLQGRRPGQHATDVALRQLQAHGCPRLPDAERHYTDHAQAYAEDELLAQRHRPRQRVGNAHQCVRQIQAGETRRHPAQAGVDVRKAKC